MIDNSINIEYNNRLTPSIQEAVIPREQNDYSKERIFKTLLPLLVMIEPIGKALELVGGVYSTYEAIQNNEKNLAFKILNITFHATSVGLLWINPLAVSLIQNGWDIVKNTHDCGKCLLEKDFKTASSHAFRSSEKCIFVASILIGGPNIILVSMIAQTTLEAYRFTQLAQKDMPLEFAVQAVVLGVRGYGVYKHLDSNKEHFTQLYNKIQSNLKVFNQDYSKGSTDKLQISFTEFLNIYFASPEFRKGWSKLLFAVHNGYDDISLILMNDSKSLKNVENEHGKLLFSAINNGNPKVLTSLIEHGVSANAKIFDPNNHLSGYTPLSYAFDFTNSDVIPKILIENGADIRAKDNINGNTPLHGAVRKGYLDIVKLFIDKGVDLNINNRSKISPLCEASVLINKNDSYKTYLEMNDLLIQNGADVNNKNGKSPFNMTIPYLNRDNCIQPEKVLNHLLDQGMVVPKDSLLGAVGKGANSSILTGFLIEHGADVNVNSGDCHIVSQTVLYGNPQSLQLLLNAGADTEVVSRCGNSITANSYKTPLQLAIQCQNLEMTTVLINANADLHNRGMHQYSPLEMVGLGIGVSTQMKNYVYEYYYKTLNR